MSTTIALPFLDAMVPALSARALKPTPRFGFVYIANGVIQNQWTPATTGAGFELPPTLQPFANLREKISVLTGLSHLQADTFGDGTGDHPRASAVWLTGVHAYDRTQPGVEVKLATTVDQLLVREIGKSSRIPSIEMSVDFPTQGSCDSGDCFYVNTVSWRNETTPNNTESHPRILFERLFGDGGSAEARQARSQSEGSILDSVREEANRVASSLGRGDKTKLGEYLDSVREVEQRIENAGKKGELQGWRPTLDKPNIPRPPDGIPQDIGEHMRLMADILVLGFQTDTTRITTLKLNNDHSSLRFPNLGVDYMIHHLLSHSDTDDWLKVNRFFTEQVAYIAKKLDAVKEGERTLLDNSMILFMSSMMTGNHNNDQLPVVLLGRGGGKIKTGRSLDYLGKPNRKMCSLYLSLLGHAGVHLKEFGDSKERLAEV